MLLCKTKKSVNRDLHGRAFLPLIISQFFKYMYTDIYISKHIGSFYFITDERKCTS